MGSSHTPFPLDQPCLVALPHELSDEAAAHVSELLNDLAVAFDGQYFAQVRRYYDERRDIERFCHDGQLDLFDYDDVEF